MNSLQLYKLVELIHNCYTQTDDRIANYYLYSELWHINNACNVSVQDVHGTRS